MGVSAGVGKTTFANKLGEILQINVYHLDALYWNPGWVEASNMEFTTAQKKIVQQKEWIIEGNYTATYEIRAEHADTIIYLELPLLTCLYRVVKRWVKHRGTTRPDMGKDCPEKIDWAFIRFILTTYYPRKKAMIKRLREFQDGDKERNIFILRGNKDIQGFLKNHI